MTNSPTMNHTNFCYRTLPYFRRLSGPTYSPRLDHIPYAAMALLLSPSLLPQLTFFRSWYNRPPTSFPVTKAVSFVMNIQVSINTSSYTEIYDNHTCQTIEIATFHRQNTNRAFEAADDQIITSFDQGCAVTDL